jgi:hypothetical protein
MHSFYASAITVYSIIFGSSAASATSFSSLPCPPGWIRNLYSCYLVANQNTTTWFDARQKCQNLGSNLVVINDQREFDYVIRLAAEPNKYFWVYICGIYTWIKNFFKTTHLIVNLRLAWVVSISSLILFGKMVATQISTIHGFQPARQFKHTRMATTDVLIQME